MQNITVRIIPIVFLAVFTYAAIKKVKLYDAFTEGVKEVIPLCVSIFPYLVSIFIMMSLFEMSGASKFLCDALSPVFSFFGIPKELSRLVLIKPFSGTGSFAYLSEIYTTYNPDSYISRCASVIYGSSDTVFYIAAVYFAKSKMKKLFKPVAIALCASFFSTVFSAFICLIL